ncbi:hypothetical protein LSTR_LSTR000008 [Laodelphax striatellus]|uniref:NADH dehydrogenase [ubiquinone] 1 alpha subcomplex subunit 7 n=1 Tax=Laodelphax striatellus TaxID=195883 RepID=A0A482X692_LAOST|nr:hypothetical protein LSTR_LSTR000008 [Laodelphax striatellus]
MIRMKLQKSLRSTVSRLLSKCKRGMTDMKSASMELKKSLAEPHRDVSWPLQRARVFFSGREYVSHLIFKDQVSSYSPALPSLPRTSKLSENFYCSRDARQEVVPPKIIYPEQYSAKPEQIESDSDSESTAKTPGPVYGDACVPCSYKKLHGKKDYGKPSIRI